MVWYRTRCVSFDALAIDAKYGVLLLALLSHFRSATEIVLKYTRHFLSMNILWKPKARINI